ncbi:hypothetical protein N0V90_006272 [Kalmusia sp. IMI 367209]|nr:hypothetical protein N0V90_006272 [Kalmusia sp. IMI 367209]
MLIFVCFEYIEFQTTYEYTPLPSHRHIRLLHILHDGTDADTKPTFQIIVKELPTSAEPWHFKTTSCTWGGSKRVSSFALHDNLGVISLTENLAHALPHLVRHSQTKFLGLDQLCINQKDEVEKAQQVGMMDQIYSAACRWLRAVAELLAGRDDAMRTIPRAERYSDSVRIIIELLLSSEEILKAGDQSFSMQNLSDLQKLPLDTVLGEDNDEEVPSTSYNTLMSLKKYPFTDVEPLSFLMFMAQVASESETIELANRLHAFLDMLNGSTFKPDYTQSTEVATATGRLHVRGKIIDRISLISSAKINRYFSGVEDVYLDSLVAWIQSDISESDYSAWTRTHLVHFLNTISANGTTPKKSEDVLGLESKAWGAGLVNKTGYNKSLSSCLSILGEETVCVD